MAIKVRPITREESETLDRWQRLDDIVRYRRARILRLSAAKWRCSVIAQALGLHEETVREVITAFNDGGIADITPRPRSGGRPPSYTEEVAQEAENLARQDPPTEGGRATWTLDTLAQAIAARFDHINTMSHEAVRRLLSMRGVAYRRAKKWLTSPDPLYELRKSQRDRLLAMVRTSSNGAAVWLDQSWFVRWPYQFWAWTPENVLLRVAQRWSEKVDTVALYAALDDESQETFLRWAEVQPNSEETTGFLEALMAHYAAQDKGFVVLFWDRAPWHRSKHTRAWIRAYNRRAKREGLARLIVCQLPTRSPWLMPLESIFGWIKHQVLGGRAFETVVELQAAVVRSFRERVDSAKARRDRDWATVQAGVSQNSRSVL